MVASGPERDRARRRGCSGALTQNRFFKYRPRDPRG